MLRKTSLSDHLMQSFCRDVKRWNCLEWVGKALYQVQVQALVSAVACGQKQPNQEIYHFSETFFIKNWQKAHLVSSMK